MLNKTTPNRIWLAGALLAVLGLGLWLRWRFIQTVHLYPDEFVTLLAVEMIGQKGVPLMPSGLFYEHGLLFSYLGSLAAVLGPLQPAVRYASLLAGGLTLLLTFELGRRWFSPGVALLAVAALAIAPAAIHWSGRARMYAWLQLLVLLTLWLAYEGLARPNARYRWAALLLYLAALLTHFAAVTLAPPLVAAALLCVWLHRAAASPGRWLLSGLGQKRLWLEGLGLAVALLLAFWVKRAGQPKGVEALDGSNALTGLAQVWQIYSDFSFDLLAGWQAIDPFFFNQPALLLTPLALLAAAVAFYRLRLARRRRRPALFSPTLFLSLILLLTTLEMILIVSPERRDDKYLFMLLPVLFLLGARGLTLLGAPLLARLPDRLVPLTRTLAPLLAAVLIVAVAWSQAQALLANHGDDYEAAFAYVRAHWQPGDAILTGTPAAAAFYLERSDYYSVQRRGGYDYRILTVEGQAVDRWLASPAIRTEAALHETLAGQNVWLVLERWGLQREYYDLPFQQQLLAQTDLITQAQGIFVLRAKPNPRPLAPEPAQRRTALFGEQVKLLGYTLEPERIAPGQTLRLTLYWQALAPLNHDYTVFVHLRRPAGPTVAQADHRPLAELYPTSLWPPGQTIRESSALHLPADLPPGLYQLWIGLYRLETGQRLPVQNDASGENAVYLGDLSVEAK